MKVILMHGKNTNPEDKWYPWFREQLEKKGVKTYIPELPNPSNPKIDEWLSVLKKLNPDEETILVGHSRGGIAVLRYLEKIPKDKKIKKIILLATNSGFIKSVAIPSESNYGFYTKDGYDFNKIKLHCNNFVVFHSKDDKWVPFSHGKENAEKLDAKFVIFENKGHFGKNDGIIPGLIKEVA